MIVNEQEFTDTWNYFMYKFHQAYRHRVVALVNRLSYDVEFTTLEIKKDPLRTATISCAFTFDAIETGKSHTERVIFPANFLTEGRDNANEVRA